MMEKTENRNVASLDIWPITELTTAHLLGGDYARVLRRADTARLKEVAGDIAYAETTWTPFLLDTFSLPQLASPSFWVTEVLPAIRRELTRRSRPAKTWKANSPVAKIKAENRVEDIAERFTPLLRSGNGFRGKCPIHQERSGHSFHIWTDSQRWQCFGACNRGGDVVDLIREMGQIGNVDGR